MSRVSTALNETGASLVTVFRNPGLRRVNLAFAGSAIGDWAYATAIVVWAYDVGGVTAVGVWGTLRLILMALVTPFAATLVDRYSRKAVMITTDLVRASIVATTALLIWADSAPLVVFVLATVASLVAAPFRPAVAALLPSLANEPEELTAANGAGSTIESLAFFVGPALGGVLVTAFSVPVVIALNAVTFIWSAAILSRIHVRSKAAGASAKSTTDTDGDPQRPDEPESPGFLAESMAGFRVIVSHKDLLLVSLVYCAQTIVAGASIVFGVEIAVQMTNFGPEGVGYLDSVLGIGAILGGLVAIGRASVGKLATDFGYGVIFWALPLLLAAIWPELWAAFLAMFIIGFANPIVDVNATTIVQRLVDDEVMGRVFGALETLLIAAMALGSMAMPVMVHLWGLQWSLAVLAVFIAAIVLPTMVRLRRLNATLAEPEGMSLLRAVPLFAPLDMKSLELIAQQLGRRQVAPGEAVINEGDPGDRFYIVESGHTTATYRGEVLSTQGPGDPFGEIALLRDVPRTATVVADVDSVVLFLERDDFLDAVTGDSEVSSRADDLIARRIPTY